MSKIKKVLNQFWNKFTYYFPPSSTTSALENSDCSELDPEKIEVIDKVVTFIKSKDLEMVALLFLESLRPLHFVGSQAMIFFSPYLSILSKEREFTLFRESMEEKRYFNYLLNQLEKSKN